MEKQGWRFIHVTLTKPNVGRFAYSIGKLYFQTKECWKLTLSNYQLDTGANLWRLSQIQTSQERSSGYSKSREVGYPRDTEGQQVEEFGWRKIFWFVSDRATKIGWNQIIEFWALEQGMWKVFLKCFEIHWRFLNLKELVFLE